MASLCASAVCSLGSFACCISSAACSCCCSCCPSTVSSTMTRAVYFLLFISVSLLGWVMMDKNIGAGLAKMSDKTGAVFEDSDFLAFFGAEDGISTGLDLCETFDSTCDKKWSQLAVFRVMFALAVFHAFLGLLMTMAKSGTGALAACQNGLWLFKIVLLVGLMVAAFFIKNGVWTGAWSYIATVGACIFLLLQSFAVSIVADRWNESIKGQITDKVLEESCAAVKVKVAFWMVFFTAGTIAMNVIIYSYFTCSNKTANGIANANIVLVVGLHLVAFGAASVSARRVAKGHEEIARVGLLQPAIVCFFMTYQTWSAVAETNAFCPTSESTFGNATNTSSLADGSGSLPGARTTDIITSMLGMTWVIVVVSFISLAGAPGRAEIDALAAKEDNLPEDETTQIVVNDESEGLTYNWWLFHCTLSCGALYVSCLLTNWGRLDSTVTTALLEAADTQEDAAAAIKLASASQFAALDGMGSVWIQAGFSWVTAFFYLFWSLPPLFFPDREWASESASSTTSQV